MNELISREDLYQAVKNLQEYIDLDIAYQSNNSVYDFDDFCISHCRDIDIVLSYVKNAYELLNGEKMEDKKC